ncbi:MAG: sirohydrochlorin chelatase, partial [Bacillota bacterium]|nr:sirohydrochlorin chelatase [Bacillota bacterium]
HNPNVYLSSYIGFHPHVKNAFLNRVRETAANSEGQFDFDGDSYASAAH